MSQTRPSKSMQSTPYLTLDMWHKVLGILKAHNVERGVKRDAIEVLNKNMDDCLSLRHHVGTWHALWTPESPPQSVCDWGCNPGYELKVIKNPQVGDTAARGSTLMHDRWWVLLLQEVVERLQGEDPLFCLKCWNDWREGTIQNMLRQIARKNQRRGPNPRVPRHGWTFQLFMPDGKMWQPEKGRCLCAALYAN